MQDTQAGFVLSFSVLIAGVLLSVGLAIFSITLKELLLSSGGRESQFAFYAADTGGECALYWDIKHPGYSGSVFAPVQAVASSSVPTEGLSHHWPFDETSGTTASDFAGTANGILNNMTDADWVSGEVNNALQFDGNNEYVDLGSSGCMASGEGTVSFWVNPSNPDNYDRIFIQGADECGTKYMAVWYNGKIYFLITPSDSADRPDINTTTIPSGTWSHVTWIFDGQGEHDVYVNGNPSEGTYEWSYFTLASVGGGNYFGTRAASGNYFDGTLDDFRIYDRELSPGEILSLYSGGEEIVTSYANPVAQDSGLMCNNEDISDPSTGWDVNAGWDVSVDGNATTTVFDMEFENGSCATVSVRKSPTQTRIDSLGYNTCDTGDPRRVERGLRITY